VISALNLPRKRKLSLVHAQRCSFLIMEQCCGFLSVEIIPGNHCDFSTYLTKRAKTQSDVCAEVHFPNYGTVLWSRDSRNCSRKHCDFSNYLAKRARAQSVAWAEVQLLDYGTELWSPGSRNNSRRTLRFQHLSCQESESSVWRMRRCAVSRLWKSAVITCQ
jgi:hypothetical protein